METRRVFEEAYRDIEKSEVAVIRNVHEFPVYHSDIISPYLMLFICHSGSSRALYDMREVVFRPNEVAMILPNHIIRPIESSPDYSITIIIHSIAFEKEMTQKRMTHDRNKFHELPACSLTDEEIRSRRDRLTRAVSRINKAYPGTDEESFRKAQKDIGKYIFEDGEAEKLLHMS